MMSKTILALCVVTPLTLNAAETQTQIRIVGSSTVYPFTTTVSENFAKYALKAPIVEATGTGGGMKLFCEGVGFKFVDASNASRRIKKSEFELCAKHGVSDILELKIGFDGLVLANSKQAKPFNITRQQLFLALAKDVPVKGEMVANPYKKWREIDASLPDMKIEVMGPPPSSGTRDSLHELFLEAGADSLLKDLKKQDKKAFDKAWKTLRTDGAYIEAGENDNLIVQKLEADTALVGIFGFSFLAENASKINGFPIESIAPDFDTIANGSYKGARELYIYFKKQHFAFSTALEPFLKEYISNKSMKEEGYLERKGLVPLPNIELEKVRQNILTPMSKEGLH